MDYQDADNRTKADSVRLPDDIEDRKSTWDTQGTGQAPKMNNLQLFTA